MYTELFSLLQFRRSHVVACKDKGRLAADAPHILSAMLLNHQFVFVTAMMLEHSAYDDALSLESVGGLCCLLLAQSHLQTVASQPFDNLEILLVVEIRHYAFCHHFANAVDLEKLLQSGIFQCIDILEMACNEFS